MNCNFNFGCQCNNCKNFVNTTAVTLSGDSLILTIPSSALCNGSCKCIHISQAIPTTITANTVVRIQVGATFYPVIKPCGSLLYADQIRTNRTYCFKFASDSLLFTYRGGWRLCKTAHQFNCVPMATTAGTSETEV